jgi:hypothetical protein
MPSNVEVSMPKRSVHLLFLVVGSLIAFASCSSKPDNAWLTTSMCEPPCWHNIVPGKTTSSELEPLLFANPYVDDKSVANRDAPMEIFNDIYYFSLKNHIQGEIWLLDDKVASILWFFPRGGEVANSLGLTVGELIKEYGEPDFVVRINDIGPGPLPILSATHPLVFLINSKRGIVFRYDEYQLPKKLHNQVTPGIEVGYLKFFSPDDFDRLLEAGEFTMFTTSNKEDTLSRLQTWRGYGEYPDIK